MTLNLVCYATCYTYSTVSTGYTGFFSGVIIPFLFIIFVCIFLTQLLISAINHFPSILRNISICLIRCKNATFWWLFMYRLSKLLLYLICTILPSIHHRGISSTVRKCTHRKSNVKFAVKIIDLHTGNSTEDIVSVREEYLNEVAIIKKLSKPPGHPNISKYTFCTGRSISSRSVIFT